MEEIKVITALGELSGTRENGIAYFKGVPYAEAPTGDLRFRAPRAKKKWNGCLECKQWAQDCIQIPRKDRVPRGPKLPNPTTEDCLKINILAPEDAQGKHPVFVWLHGGDILNRGGVPMVKGEAFVKKGIVFVSPVWRCGVFGNLGIEEFKDRDEHRSTGCYGILDLIECLRFVKDNIEAFGGDPDNVTIGGQSSGAMTVKSLICAPPAKGLFHRAIAMSGGGIWDVDGTITFERKNELCHECMAIAGVTAEDLLTGDAAELSERLGSAMADMEFERVSLSKMFFKPSADGYALFCDAGKRLSEGCGADVDIMAGTIREEWNNFVHQVPGGIEGYNVEFALAAALSWAERNIELGKKPVYHYFFDHDLPGEDPRPHHGSEMQYVFASPAEGRPWTQYDYLISNTVLDYWTSFIKTGDPGSYNRPEWPPYTADTRLTMHIRNDGMTAETLITDPKVRAAVDFLLANPGVLHKAFFEKN